MTILAIIGAILLLGIAFVGLGLLGHLMELLGDIFSWLFDGCMSTVGCFFWIFMVLTLLAVIL